MHKKLGLFFSIATILSANSVFATSRNLCDDLVDSKASAEQIKKCQDKFGVSQYAKEKAILDSQKKEVEDAKKEDKAKNESNLEFKTFKNDELKEVGFGKPFYAVKTEYKKGKYSEEKLMTGETLCVFLGYEKAMKSSLSSEINLAEASGKGLVVEKNFFGSIKEEPKMFKETSANADTWVRQFNEVTCVKRKDKKVENSEDTLKLINEVVVVKNEPMGSIHSESDDKVDNSKKGAKESKGTFTPVKPAWMEDDSTSKSK